MDKLFFGNSFEADTLGSAAGFVPEWDAPSVNERITDDLRLALEKARRGTSAGGREKARILLGAPGHGKTHLFGRVRHAEAGKLFFVYVPQVLDPGRPAEHVRWHLVEALFAEQNGPLCPLGHFLASLLAPSFRSYLAGLPAAFTSRHHSLCQRVAVDPLAVLDLVRSVEDLAPFHPLAESVSQRFPTLPADVLRGLVLGLSSAGHHARCWLRGDALPGAKLADLCLPPLPPAPKTLLHAVAVLLQQLHLPVLLCFDQFEAVLKEEHGPKALTTEVMAWVDEIPNLLVVMSCLESEWKTLEDRGFKAFRDRVLLFKLDPLSPAQAREIVRRRLASWDEFRPERGDLWPFDAGKIDELAEKKPLNPRGFVRLCSAKLSAWMDQDPRPSTLIDVTVPIGAKPLKEAFLEYWNQELFAIQQAKLSAADHQEDRLFAGVHEALKIAREGGLVLDGAQILEMQEGALAKTNADARPSLDLRVGVGNEAFHIVVAVTRNDKGPRFGAYLKALEEAIAKPVVGAVLVRPVAKLGVGRQAQAAQKYNEAIRKQRLRPFALDTEAASFALLECLMRVVQKAEAGDIQLANQSLDPAACRRLLVELKLLDNLKLFEFVLKGWPALEEARRAAGQAKAPAAQGPHAEEKKEAGTSLAATAPARAAAGAAGRPAGSGAARGNSSPPPAVPSPPPAVDGHAWAENVLAQLVDLLRTYKQPVSPQGAETGPTFVRLAVLPQGQTDVAKIRRKAENIQIALKLPSRPIVGTQAGYVSIDVERPDRQTVPLDEALAGAPSSVQGQTAFPVGADVSGRCHWLNLAEPSSCHLLIAGTTGSGKSEFMKAMLAALARRLAPDAVQFVLIDPKRVTFNFTGESPYLRAPIAHDVAEAMPLIEDCFQEMERRYELLSERHLENVSELPAEEALPRIVVLFDEFADLMLDRDSRKELETLLKRLGAKARAAGIHLVLGTQRTEASVVTPLLRSNLPGRISLKVMGERDSKLILDAPDAAHLLGRGDLLWWRGGGMLRLQSPFVGREQLEQCLRIV
jgi:S-DNA-T family DNA segregation ATPase FtsK/SpoIIIE